MSSEESFVKFIVDQIDSAGSVSYRKMFGEYAIYVDGKVAALVCDNQLFVKPPPAGRAHIGAVVEAPAYPGAKPSFLIEDHLEDRDWLTDLFRITAGELPAPKPKAAKARKTAKAR